MMRKKACTIWGFSLFLLLFQVYPVSSVPGQAGENPFPRPVSLQSRIILQTLPHLTQVALILSKKAEFTHRLVPLSGNLGEIRLYSRSWDFPSLRSLVTGDQLVRSVNLRREREGSSIRIRLLRPVTYRAEWIDDLSQLRVVLRPKKLRSKESSAAPLHEGGPQKKGEALQLARAAQVAGGEKGKEIKVEADTITVGERGKVIEARGKAEIQRGKTILKADELKVDTTRQEVEAKGTVSVDDPQGTLKADAVRFNLEQETGEIENGEIFFKQPHLSVSGRRFQKLAGQVYHIDQGVFTTCLCESGPPTWKISAEEVHLRREGEGIIKGGTFYILDVPVFYLPYGFFPLRSERKTGLLFPQIGSSSKEGFRLQQPFFWAISKSSDATFGVDVETSARIGLLGELRTVFSREAQAQINLSYFNEGLRTDAEDDIGDRTIADPEIPRDRWSVIAAHRHTTSSGWVTYSDVLAVSDDLFTRELDDRFERGVIQERGLRTRRYDRSRFGFFKSWGDMHLRGEWNFYQDFIQSDARTLHKTPQLTFRGRHALGKTPLELRWRAEGVNFLRRKGGDGLRLDLRPEIVVPFRLPPYLLGSFNFAVRETAYHLYSVTDITSAGTRKVLDRNSSRELVEIRGNIGTSFERVFTWNGRALKKMKHVVEPEMSYFFIPSTNQSGIPVMDGTDRINRRNLLTFSLTNRFWGKFAGEPIGSPKERDVELLTSPPGGEVREMGRLRLALSYDIDEERKGGDSLSDLDLNLQLTPVDYLTLGADTGLNPGPWQVTQAAARLSLSDPQPPRRRVLDPDFMQPNQINLRYRFVRRGALAQLATNANLKLTQLLPERLIRRNVLGEVNVNALVHLTDHLLGLYDATYNSREARFTNNQGGIKILSQCECWTLSFSIGRKTNPAKTTFKFDFNLLGLSSQNLDLSQGIGFSP